MQELNFDIASEFLIMAVTLLYWKSRSLLPHEETKETTEQEENIALSQELLILQLLEHQRFLHAGQSLQKFPLLGQDVFTHAQEAPPAQRIWGDMDRTSLALAYQQTLLLSRKRTQILQKETVSLSDKILEMSDRLIIHQLTGLRSLLSPHFTRGEIVVTFLASLELSRLYKMRLHQEKCYSEIYLELLESIKDLNSEWLKGEMQIYGS